jgi:hypothetical protein
LATALAFFRRRRRARRRALEWARERVHPARAPRATARRCASGGPSRAARPRTPFAPFAAHRAEPGAGSLLPVYSFPEAEEPGGGFGGLSPDGAALEAAVAAATRAAAGEADA